MLIVEMSLLQKCLATHFWQKNKRRMNTQVFSNLVKILNCLFYKLFFEDVFPGDDCG